MATCHTPFEFDARHPCLGVEPMRISTVEATDTFTRQLDHAQEEVKAALEWAVDDMKCYYDWNCQAAPEYKVRDKAWLNLQNCSSNCPMKKLDHKWAGPFIITKVISPTTIKLQLSAQEKNIHPVISISSICNPCNPALSLVTTKKNMKLRKSWTPGSGGVNYGTWWSSLAGHTWITCGSPTLKSMPQHWSRTSTFNTLMHCTPPPPPFWLLCTIPDIEEKLCHSET